MPWKGDFHPRSPKKLCSGFTLMASAISKSRSVTPLTTPPAPTNSTSTQLKKLLASPKKEIVEPPPLSRPFHLSPPSMDSTPNDPDDFMNQLSQNTVSFHASTHSGGRPISPSVQRFAATPSPPVEDTTKTRALAQVLSLNSNSSTKKPTGGGITGIALQQPNGKKTSPSDVFPTDREIGAKSRVAQAAQHSPSSNSMKIDSSALLAPSDLTGVKFSFPM